MSDEQPELLKPVKKKFKWRPKHIIFLLVVVVLTVLILRFTTPFGNLDVNLEGKDSLEGGTNIFRETTEDVSKSYPITSEIIDLATRELLKHLDAIDAAVIPQGGTLGIAVIVAPGTSPERAKELAEYYLKALSGAAAAEYADISGPTDTSLGQIYNYYELVITVGTSTEKEDFISEGTKGRGANSIFWR
jgi:hypothetical protein